MLSSPDVPHVLLILGESELSPFSWLAKDSRGLETVSVSSPSLSLLVRLWGIWAASFKGMPWSEVTAFTSAPDPMHVSSDDMASFADVLQSGNFLPTGTFWSVPQAGWSLLFKWRLGVWTSEPVPMKEKNMLMSYCIILTYFITLS